MSDRIDVENAILLQIPKFRENVGPDWVDWDAIEAEPRSGGEDVMLRLARLLGEAEVRLDNRNRAIIRDAVRDW